MNKILIKSVSILSPQSKYHKQVTDVFIVDGKIFNIENNIEVDKQTLVIDGNKKFLSPGFFDLNVHFGEPGLETKEDIHTGCSTAAAGGFTGIAIMPSTQPPIHSKTEVAYLLSKAQHELVQIYPLGCISYSREGKDLAEMFDMSQSGAVAFTDGYRPIVNAGLMSRALLYSKGFNGLIFSFPEDPQISGNGRMNEGKMSTLLGMKGQPALAEELIILRDLHLAKYHEARIHFSTLSSKKSVELIRQAKKEGLQVSCDVAAHHLVFSEEELIEFDSNYKVKPPLRTKEDQTALLAGLNDGTIDAIVSQHTPHEIELKNIEFEKAAYGVIGLQTSFNLALRAGLSPEILVEKMAINPRKILSLNPCRIEPEEIANLTLFDPEETWIFDASTNRSKSTNSPLMGQTLKGKVKWIYNNNQYLEF